MAPASYARAAAGSGLPTMCRCWSISNCEQRGGNRTACKEPVFCADRTKMVHERGNRAPDRQISIFLITAFRMVLVFLSPAGREQVLDLALGGCLGDGADFFSVISNPGRQGGHQFCAVLAVCSYCAGRSRASSRSTARPRARLELGEGTIEWAALVLRR